MSADYTQGVPQPPSNRPHAGYDDVRAAFDAISAKAPVDQAFRDAFIQSKIRIAHTHPELDLTASQAAVQQTIKSLGPEAHDARSQPTPGGVGYGVFYTAAFKNNWGTGTSMAFDPVCPQPPGGNVNTFLYLTATNRAGLGVEAFVSYNGQNDSHFRVFDWSRNDHWQTDIPFAQLGKYLAHGSAHGHPYQVLPIWNSTWRINATTYRNQALLYNHVRGGWDLVYQHDYTASDAQQKNSWIGSWAPIVETFQSSYNHTQPMGALATQLISANNNGQWGSWGLLAASNSTIRTDNVGFHREFLDPDYAFVVVS
ncbi:hypothetical protein [Janthinobacterium sp.]|uniref:hypothetical protein n=1 Tax=Janthinobacterium sp. TaxID=1871054 RepID=UPI00293D5F09|nr:hypothetical protein [Janthinobacterium sp.]